MHSQIAPGHSGASLPDLPVNTLKVNEDYLHIKQMSTPGEYLIVSAHSDLTRRSGPDFEGKDQGSGTAQHFYWVR
jgi:hypothetical protein